MNDYQKEWDRLKVLPVGHSGRSYNDNVQELDEFVGRLVACQAELEAEVERLTKENIILERQLDAHDSRYGRGCCD
jgi:hypothetical protein